MRWSPEGAHYLLQGRAELLNGTVRTWFKDGVDCHIRAADTARAITLNFGYRSRKSSSRRPSIAAHRTCRRRWAPSADQRIGWCFPFSGLPSGSFRTPPVRLKS